MFQNDLKHGEGVLKFTDGDFYAGSFNRDMMDG